MDYKIYPLDIPKLSNFKAEASAGVLKFKN